MSRHKSGSIVTKNNKIYARLRFVDEVGKKRDIWRIVSSRVEAKKKLRELIKDSETKTTIAVFSCMNTNEKSSLCSCN